MADQPRLLPVLGNNAQFVALRLFGFIFRQTKTGVADHIIKRLQRSFCLWLLPNRYRHFDPIGTAFIQSEAGAGQPFVLLPIADCQLPIECQYRLRLRDG
jgi:hypothetical protein